MKDMNYEGTFTTIVGKEHRRSHESNAKLP